ncbi:hypothetical protein [Vulgatibacter sp.]|uniref:hypothetical protein n=1 Tax=Vulgatibacter sp. TaxID=1971226 RepID=UPI00356B28E7
MRRLGIFGIGVAIAFAIASARAHEPVERLAPVALQGLDVTLGALREADGRLLVEAAKFRAVALRRTAPVAELDFTYVGPTEQAAPLASGELRRQLGLKLRAADGCNLVYVMWRIDPKPALVVSIKRNPGKRTHAQCGAGGYRNVKPERAVPLPKLQPGERHVLRAALAGDRLVVQVDGRAVWEGALGEEILAFDGPVGLRTDNARVAFQLRMP